MKKIWIIFGALLLALVLYKAILGPNDLLGSKITKTSSDGRDKVFHQEDSTVAPAATKASLGVLEGKYATKADSIVAFALQRYGADYSYGGVTEEGFDCSGFITYVFQQFGLSIPHGTAFQSKLGESVSMQEAKKGDLIIFTGTNLEDRTPDHIGIIITNPPKAIKFVHSSSNGGVKVSEVEGTLYQKRFLDIRRVMP